MDGASEGGLVGAEGLGDFRVGCGEYRVVVFVDGCCSHGVIVPGVGRFGDGVSVECG